ncbi:hypothetical protein [Methanoculleus caldifontis]|uniref:hypothetical protein n=1 Tax=Methanoculleus caldifontis TaxID=2651577 RepID=UPI0029372A87|nr:hypothetical protein [Methanoculleus sp. Wushi-C6]
MERSAFTTFACLAERAAGYPTVVRRSQMRKAIYVVATTPAPRIPREAGGYV